MIDKKSMWTGPCRSMARQHGRSDLISYLDSLGLSDERAPFARLSTGQSEAQRRDGMGKWGEEDGKARQENGEERQEDGEEWQEDGRWESEQDCGAGRGRREKGHEEDRDVAKI